VNSNVEQAHIDFKQKIYLQVAQFNMQQNQLFIAAKSDTVAQRSYNITKNRYFLGKIDVTELNIARRSNDQARLSYLTALQSYWMAYYQLRKNTLFDFTTNQPLDVDFEELLR
jgi:outer membrane protein TolC